LIRPQSLEPDVLLQQERSMPGSFRYPFGDPEQRASSKGDKSLNVMLEVRWLDAQTLQVSVAKRVAKFYEKKSRYDDVAIRYTTMSAQP
jgi:hypothetical protein